MYSFRSPLILGILCGLATFDWFQFGIPSHIAFVLFTNELRLI